MRIKGNLILPDGIRHGIVEFTEYIEGIYENGSAEIDFGDSFIGPGFIDIHFHGGMGESFNRCNNAGLKKILDYCVCHGTTSCLAGITTDEENAISKAVMKIKSYMKSGQNRKDKTAEVLGVHLEGPFLNPDMCGGMDPSKIVPANLPLFKKWENSGVIKLITIAPEMPGAGELIDYITQKKSCTISAGHTKAEYEQMQRVIENGVTHITHFYNAMTGFHHRKPGVAGAGIFSDATLELITDDIHVHPIMCKLVLKLKDPNKVCLVTDSVASAGLSNGEHMVDGRPVLVKGGSITLKSGVLAGSAHTMDRAVKNTTRFVDLHTAWMMASKTPAKEIGVLSERGELKVGNIADFAVLDNNLLPVATFIKGGQVWKSEEG